METEETARLTALVAHETNPMAVVQEYTLGDKRWVFATNGWLLAMIQSEQPVEPLRIPGAKKTIECKKEPLGVVEAQSLVEWAGPIEPDRWNFCKECDGRGKVPFAGTLYNCGECDGAGGYNFTFFMPGLIWNRPFSRQLLARGLWVIEPSGQVELFFGQTKKQRDDYKLLWVQQEGRRLALMQMAERAVDRSAADLPRFEW